MNALLMEAYPQARTAVAGIIPQHHRTASTQPAFPARLGKCRDAGVAMVMFAVQHFPNAHARQALMAEYAIHNAVVEIRQASNALAAIQTAVTGHAKIIAQILPAQFVQLVPGL